MHDISWGTKEGSAHELALTALKKKQIVKIDAGKGGSKELNMLANFSAAAQVHAYALTPHRACSTTVYLLLVARHGGSRNDLSRSRFSSFCPRD